MRTSTALLAALPVALASFVGAVSGSAADTARTPPSKGFRLARFGSCDEIVRYAKQHTLPLVRDFGLPTFPELRPRATSFESVRRAGVDYSTTNVQEEGVDEPDLVKTNGSYIFTVHGRRLHAVDVRGRTPRVVATVPLELRQHDLLLRGRRLLVLSRNRYEAYEPLPANPRRLPPYGSARTMLTELDVGNPAAPRVLRTLTIEGHYLAARRHGRSVRLVLMSSMPRDLRFTGSREENQALVSGAPLQSWLPSYELRPGKNDAATKRYLVQCRHVWRPRVFSGLGLLTILTLNLDRGLEPTNTVSVLADGQTVYASGSSIYAATERWSDRPLDVGGHPARRGVRTTIHKFGLGNPAKTRYRASGSVAGFFLSPWSLSEHEGVLRVASTNRPLDETAFWETHSFVTTLEEQRGRLVELGRLAELGRGERMYAVRFIGDVGYVVTFRQVDPLYTLDLSNPRRPRVLGKLKIPGYSAYLHPVGKDLVFGLGRDDAGGGRLTGVQASLFDVSNLRRPVRLHHKLVARGWSHAEYDHHAFLYWRPARLVVVPVYGETSLESFSGALGIRVERKSGITAATRIAHPVRSYVSRALVVGDSLYTVSDMGVEERGLRSLRRRGWAAFPRV
jgi:Beta propeller domain